jgi:hypothetical protein
VNSWKVILATLVIFGSGVVTGGLLVSYAVHANIVQHPTPPPMQQPQQQALTPWMQRARELLRLMDRDLDLTPEQHKRIEKLIGESAERTKKLWEPITPQMGKEMQKLHREIRDELTPEQRPKFEKITRFRAGQQNRRPPTNQPPGFQTNSVPTNTAPANP